MSDAPAPAAAVPAAPAGNKMLFIMLGAMFFLLIAGMGGMYFMMKGGDKPAAAATEKGEGAEEAKEEAHEEKAKALYVGLEPPFVVNFPADSPVKFLQVQVQIMTRETTMEHLIRGNDPAIRNDLLNLFGGQTYEALATTEGKEALRAKALETVQGVIKREGGDSKLVEAVYFTSFVMQ